MNRIVIIAFLAILSACDRATPEAPRADSHNIASSQVEPNAEPESSPETANQDPMEALAAMDPRTPVPLQPMMAWHQKQNMMDHLVAIQEINSGVADEDWPKVEAAAARIGSSPQMRTMCEHMGKGADGFTELALEFHSRADAIGEAAKRKDSTSVIRETGRTLEACTSCHAAYRQQVVSPSEWTRLTSAK